MEVVDRVREEMANLGPKIPETKEKGSEVGNTGGEESLNNYIPVPYGTPSTHNLNPFHYHGGSGSMFSPIPQPFDESNLRNPVNQTYGTSIPNPANPQGCSSSSWS